LAILPCIHLADSVCTWKPTPGSFAPAETKKAVTCVDPSNIGSSVDNVNGFSLTLETIMSYNSTCGTDATVLKVNTKNPGFATFSGFVDTTAPETPAKPAVGSVSCQLDGLALEKEDATATSKVLLRFDFHNCTGASTAKTGTSGSAVVELMKVPDSDVIVATPAALPMADLSTFFHEVCQKKAAPKEAPPVVQQVKLQIAENPVGLGACKGTKYRSAPKAEVSSRSDCKMECVGSIEKYVKLTDKKNMCTGYSFSSQNTSDTTTCNLYKGEWSGSTGVAADGWCWNMTEKSTAFSEDNGAAEAAAAQQKKELEAMKTAPRLAMEAALLAEGASVALYESPESCFDSFFWAKLQDKKGAPAVLKIKAKEYDALFAQIPAPTARRLAPAVDPSLSVSLSHAVYTNDVRAYYQKVFGLGAPVEAAAPVAAAPECVNGEIMNAFVTALLVPVILWMVLWVVFEKFLSKPTSQYTSLSDEDAVGGCTQNNIMVLILVTVLVGALLSFGLTHVLAIAFTPVCAASPHGLTMITISSGLSAVVGAGLGLYYMSTPHHSIHAGKGGGGEGSKFMLVRVQGNKNVPVLKSEIVESSQVNFISTIA